MRKRERKMREGEREKGELESAVERENVSGWLL